MIQQDGLTRRDFISAIAVSSGAALLPRRLRLNYRSDPNGTASFDFRTGILQPNEWPDGKEKRGGLRLINGMLPGPIVRVTEGQEVLIRVFNGLPEPTSIHWHGQHQRSTWFMDGVAMISQAPIPTGSSYIYKFRAYPAGTHWYHSHAGVQYGDGLFGAFIVEAKDDPYRNDYDYDHVIIINDWFHVPADEILQNLKDNRYMPMGMQMSGQQMPDIGDVPFQSALINGKGQFDINQHRKFDTLQVKSGDRVRLRIINASSTYAFRFAIDEHRLSIIACDGAQVKSQTVDNLIIDVGETYDAIVVFDRTISNYWIRARTLEETENHQVLGLLRYEGTSESAPETRADWNLKSLSLYELNSLDRQRIKPPTIETRLILSGSMMPYEWKINGKTFELPPRPLAEERNSLHSQLFKLAIKQGEIIRIVISNTSEMSHPFHLHGHYFHVLAMGNSDSGDYDGQTLNDNDPIQKNTLRIPRKSWAVVQWEADNPGFWFFHCHVQWHMAVGMAILVVEGDPPYPPKNPDV